MPSKRAVAAAYTSHRAWSRSLKRMAGGASDANARFDDLRYGRCVPTDLGQKDLRMLWKQRFARNADRPDNQPFRNLSYASARQAMHERIQVPLVSFDQIVEGLRRTELVDHTDGTGGLDLLRVCKRTGYSGHELVANLHKPGLALNAGSE